MIRTRWLLPGPCSSQRETRGITTRLCNTSPEPINVLEPTLCFFFKESVCVCVVVSGNSKEQLRE